MKKGQKKREKITRKERKLQKKITKFYFAIAGVLFVLLIYLVGNNLGIFHKNLGPQRFPVEDECGNIMGNVIHNLRDEGDCKIRCENNCEFREMNYHNSSFTFQETSCHTCDCYCI